MSQLSVLVTSSSASPTKTASLAANYQNRPSSSFGQKEEAQRIESVENKSEKSPEWTPTSEAKTMRTNPTPSGPAQSPFAYAFLLTGCDPEADKPWHLGFLYGIMVAVQVLRDGGSKADFIIMIRMTSPSGNATVTEQQRLPQEEWLRALNMRIMYIPSPDPTSSQQEDFGEAQMNKFHILHLTEYQRILYLDSDVLPLCNLDYIFHLSTEAGKFYLKPNFVMAWTEEPANGGFFMLEPKEGDYEQLQAIIAHQRDRDRHLPYPHFDLTRGWGHRIKGTPDKWWARRRQGRAWNFYAANADQGLLYHWVKYVKKNVFIAQIYRGEWWGTNEKGTLVLEKTAEQPLTNFSCLPKRFDKEKMRYAKHPAFKWMLLKHPPYGDHIHFYSVLKPWVRNESEAPIQDRRHAPSALSYWFHVLRKLNAKLSMGVDFENWKEHTMPMQKNSVNRVFSMTHMKARKL